MSEGDKTWSLPTTACSPQKEERYEWPKSWHSKPERGVRRVYALPTGEIDRCATRVSRVGPLCLHSSRDPAFLAGARWEFDHLRRKKPSYSLVNSALTVRTSATQGLKPDKLRYLATAQTRRDHESLIVTYPPFRKSEITWRLVHTPHGSLGADDREECRWASLRRGLGRPPAFLDTRAGGVRRPAVGCSATN